MAKRQSNNSKHNRDKVNPDKINKDSGFSSVLWYVVNSPIFALCFGIVFSLILYFISLYNMEPVFSVSEPKEIFNVQDSIPDLDIKFANKKVNNIKVVSIVFWNNGSKPIEKNNISQDYPIQIEVPREIQLLNYKIAKTSRKTLNFQTALDSSNNNQRIYFFINGDEVLEKNDGALIKIYYSGSSDIEFKVAGRIKGVNEGFELKSWDFSFRREFNLENMLKFFSLALWSLLGLSMYYKEVQNFKDKKSNNLYFASFIFFPTIGVNLYFFSLFFLGPTWIL